MLSRARYFLRARHCLSEISYSVFPWRCSWAKVKAVDGDKLGTGIDRFEIRIWTGGDAWDSPTYRAEGDLAGGQIVVHKK